MLLPGLAGALKPATASYDPYTVLLLHMDGADDGTTFTDSSASGSGSPHTVTRYNAVTKTGTKKFGTASAYFDGSGDYLTSVLSTDYDFSDDYTIEAWFYATTLTGGTYPIMIWGSDGKFKALLNISTTVIDIQLSTSQYHRTTYSFGTGAWKHIAFGKNGGTAYLYINGESQSLTPGAAGDPGDNTVGLTIGGLVGSYYWTGYIDEVRISKGVARWTANFTPPSSAYNP